MSREVFGDPPEIDDRFEDNSIRDLADWQIRVCNEADELCAKIEKLNAFMQSKLFSEMRIADQFLMVQQMLSMSEYLRILELRIAFWSIKE